MSQQTFHTSRAAGLLVVALLIPAAIGSTVNDMGSMTTKFLGQTDAARSTETGRQKPVSTPAPSVQEDTEGIRSKQDQGQYTYLLLTAGLILLAFRPTGSIIAGRH